MAEHERGNEALQEREDKYRFLVENSKDITWTIDLRGRWTFISGNVEKATGYRADEVIGRTIWDFLAPECHGLVREKLIRRLRGEDLPPYEVAVVGKDGRSTPFELHTAPILDDGGNTVGVQGVSRNITERKKAEESLRRSEERFRRMAESIDEVFFIVTPDWSRPIYVSPAYESIFGLKAADLDHNILGWLNLIVPEDRPAIKDLVERQSRGEVASRITVEYRIVRPGGSIRWIQGNTYPIRDEKGQVQMISGTAKDITERKQAEDELRKLIRVVEESPAIVVITDVEGDIEYVNPQFTRITGYTLGEARGKNPKILKSGITPPEEYKRLWDTILSGWEWRGEFCNRKKNGDLYWESAIISPLKDAGGRITGFMALKEDITERKRAEEALRKSEAELARAQQITRLGNWSWDIKEDRIEGSSEFFRLFYFADRQHIVYGEFIGRLHPEDREPVEGAVKAALSSSRPYSVDYRIVLPDGMERFIHAEGEVVRDSAGWPATMFGTVQDITERKRAEDALRDSEARLRAFLSNSEVIGWMKDEEGRYIYVSENYERRFNTRSEDWLGRTDLEFWPREIAEQFVKNDRAVLDSGQSFEVTEEAVDPDGSKSWWLSLKFPFRDSSGKRHVGGLAVDITERIRAEGAVRESERRMARAQRIARMGNWEWLVESGVVNWSDEQYRIFGLEPGSDRPTYGKFLEAVHTDDRERIRGRIRDALKAGRYVDDYRILLPNGSERIIHTEAEVEFDAAGHPVRMFGIDQDVTERRRAEEELKEAKQQAELYLDLMGHDINNLNQIALGYLELAVDAVKDDGIKTLVKKPLDAIQNSSKLIDSVRKLQKARAGELKIEAVDLGRLLAELRDQYLNVPGKDVAIDFTLCPDCRVMANGLLRDVFSNLIGNSIKHSGPSKSVWIGLGLERHRADGRDYCRVTVEDNGPGIPDTLKEKVFTRLGRENAKAAGKGLGLYLVKRLTEDFHGTVHVEDRVPGDHRQGARFVVLLPAVEK
jgi:PAS domain S-box-containing protein